MIKVTVLIGKEGAGGAEIISAVSIREAVSIAQDRHLDEAIRVAILCDPETFSRGRVPARPQASGNPRSRTRLARQN